MQIKINSLTKIAHITSRMNDCDLVEIAILKEPVDEHIVVLDDDSHDLL